MAGDNVIVREGTKVLFSIYGLHRSARYWDEPEEFCPERFLGDYNKVCWCDARKIYQRDVLM